MATDLISRFQPAGFLDEFYQHPRFIKSLKNTGELVGHEGCVNVISFSKNGDRILTGSDDGDLRIWNTYTRECLRTLKGHVTNVFAADFLGSGQSGNSEVVSGGNDADVRYYNIEKGTTTVYRDHSKKVLRLSVNQACPRTFLTCSGDGTVRMFDVRKSYPGSESTQLSTLENSTRDDYVLAQAFGGGRPERFESFDKRTHSMLVDYASLHAGTGPRRRRQDTTIYSVDMHPTDGYSFIAASGLGDVRLFDLRMIRGFSASSYVNIFKNWATSEGHPFTGAVFSHDGSQVIATMLHDFIYLFDTNRNYEREYNLKGEAGDRLAETAAARKSRTRIPAVAEAECEGLDINGVKMASLARYIVKNDFLGLSKTKSKRRQSEIASSSASLPTASSSSSSSSSFSSSSSSSSALVQEGGAEPSPKRRFKQPDAAVSSGSDDPMQVDDAPTTKKNASVDMAVSKSGGEVDEADSDSMTSLEALLRADPSVFEKKIAANADEGDDEDDNGLPKQTYLRRFKGHVSSMTIKGCNFFGRRSEWIVSGSDDARVYLWNKQTAELVNILSGHDDVVNCTVSHPSIPLLATSGIDNVVKLWEPVGEPSEKELDKLQKLITDLSDEHSDPYAGGGGQFVDPSTMCNQQ